MWMVCFNFLFNLTKKFKKRSVFMAICPTVSSPTQFALRDMQVLSTSVPVPFRKVSAEHFPVVACFSPLFFNERWQLIIPTVKNKKFFKYKFIIA
jgi:hypothetical protein